MGTTEMQNPPECLQQELQNWKSYRRIDWKFVKMGELTNGAYFYGLNRKILRKSSNLEIMFYGFPKEKKHI
jgi:hypothetical protein